MHWIGKAPLHTPEARKVDDYAGPSGKAYNKKDSDLEYISQRSSAPSSNRPSRPSSPARPSIKEPAVAAAAQPTKVEAPVPKQSNSTAGGYLISDGPKKSKPKSTQVSRTSTPKPTNTGNITKISISGDYNEPNAREGFGNKISSQTVSIVKAAKEAWRVYRVDDNSPTWPVCHISDNTDFYIRLPAAIVSGSSNLGYGR
ncbi:hypothetical protein TrVFT333_004533 [Trichoderma virens FT-333]|nr:hypothetical protein TrVFT333_004533 [Trichoderma virens FT-333]